MTAPTLKPCPFCGDVPPFQPADASDEDSMAFINKGMMMEELEGGYRNVGRVCGNCACWVGDRHGDDGTCRLSPPRFSSDPADPKCYFPNAGRDWWCAQHEPIPENDAPTVKSV